MTERVNKMLLDKAIKLSDFSMKTICKKVGITTTILHAYRKGKHYPSVLIAADLCHVLGVKVEEIWPSRFAAKEGGDYGQGERHFAQAQV